MGFKESELWVFALHCSCCLSPQVISEVTRSGSAETFLSEGVGAETQLPLFLLVDSRTASASEIMAAALQVEC